MSEKDTPRPGGEIVVYQTADGGSRIRVRLEGETVWLTQAMIAELYQTTVPNVNIHLKNIYAEGELSEEATIKEYLIVRREGTRQVSRKVFHYNLDAILAVGYRVKSPVATRFRQWATTRLREYLVKGFTLDDERLKGGGGVVDYFDELLARIREIRASEARVYQRIREIFALACDYLEGEEETQRFFATIQNKMHYAATGMTAAEIIRRRADSDKANMGLTAWKGCHVLKHDVVTAKNYAQRRQNIHIRDWEGLLDRFLRDTELPVLIGPVTVSHDDALDWAHEQYDTFVQRRRLEAEAAAEARYVEDLRTSAKMLETRRKKLDGPKKAQKKAKAKRKPRKREGNR